jgi:hypothetical protein
MAQGDYLIQNQSFPSFRSDLNSTLEAINTSNSGTSRPTSAVAGTVWLDTTNATNPTLKFFDGTDDISLAQLDYSANTVNWLDSSVVADLVNDTTPQLGGDLDVNGNDIVSVSNGDITFTPDGTGKVIISGLSFPTSDGTADQVLKTDGAGNLSFTDVSAGGMFRNIIINGDMNIAQRGTSESGITSGGYYTVDRFQLTPNTMGTWTMSQDSDVPSGQGFAKSLKIDCTTADASPSAGDNLTISSNFEGQMLQYLKKGTASAESLTLSFWVKTNKTGTYVAELYDNDNTRTINKSFTVSSADTWEKKTITYDGDTTGAFGNDNGNSLGVNFWLGAGSDFTSGTLQTSWGARVQANRAVGINNLADSTSNYINITGVQLEAGTTASDFEFLPYDVNLQRCQRYFYMHANTDADEIGIGGYYTSSQIFCDFQFPVSMRTTPSVYITTGTNYFRIFRNGAVDSFNSLTFGVGTVNMFGLYNNTEVSGTAGHAGFVRPENSSAVIGADAEL